MKTNDYELKNILNLANGIVNQACTDYRAAIRGQCEQPDKMLKEVMGFFKSDWYDQLTKIDYRYLIEKLDKEWMDGKELMRAGCKVGCPKLNKKYEFICPLCGGTAMVYNKKVTPPKRKDGARTITYYKHFICSCHRPERMYLKSETIYDRSVATAEEVKG